MKIRNATVIDKILNTTAMKASHQENKVLFPKNLSFSTSLIRTTIATGSLQKISFFMGKEEYAEILKLKRCDAILIIVFEKCNAYL